MKPRRIRAIVGYTLVGIAMLFVFLYLRFPGEALKDYATAVAAARYPGSSFSIQSVRPTFPPGIELTDVTVASRERPEAILHADHFSVRPGGPALLRGRYAIVMAAEGYGGEGKGRIDFSRPFSFKGPLSATMSVRDVRVDKCSWFRDVFVRPITGTLKGTAAFSGTAEALKGGTGNIDFTLTNGTFPLLEGFPGFEKIDFSRVEGKVSYRNGALKINQLTLSGDKLRCSLKGNVLLADDFRESQIDLNGTIEISVQGSRRMTLTIGGTLSNPKSRLM
jgi:type II secretion system protein N